MKRLPEKMMIAAIILSCGFVMQTDPSEQDSKSKGATDARTRRMLESAEASAQPVRDAKKYTRRDDRAPWWSFQ
ncbi:MAG: hypothetical protein A2075_10920 [Geobacteraceae bacterium GWC2_58_44]|nr:MAG: hypothetical protein A2075_10920 [Geobacteraceae bacterium GWC2_58_44]HBG06812.1 hypothetical protein [Geobacter sp.]